MKTKLPVAKQILSRVGFLLFLFLNSDSFAQNPFWAVHFHLLDGKDTIHYDNSNYRITLTSCDPYHCQSYVYPNKTYTFGDNANFYFSDRGTLDSSRIFLLLIEHKDSSQPLPGSFYCPQIMAINFHTDQSQESGSFNFIISFKEGIYNYIFTDQDIDPASRPFVPRYIKNFSAQSWLEYKSSDEYGLNLSFKYPPSLGYMDPNRYYGALNFNSKNPQDSMGFQIIAMRISEPFQKSFQEKKWEDFVGDYNKEKGELWKVIKSTETQLHSYPAYVREKEYYTDESKHAISARTFEMYILVRNKTYYMIRLESSGNSPKYRPNIELLKQIIDGMKFY